MSSAFLKTFVLLSGPLKSHPKGVQGLPAGVSGVSPDLLFPLVVASKIGLCLQALHDYKKYIDTYPFHICCKVESY
jgi:hypothetical protein